MSFTNNSNNKSGKLTLRVILIGFAVLIVLYYVFSIVVSYRTFKQTSPYLINGMIDATTAMKFPSYKLPNSMSSAYGAEFTYSSWLYIDDTNFASNRNGKCDNSDLLHIFHKGSYDYVPNGSSTGREEGSNSTGYPLLQCPGVWLYPNTNKLNIRFNTYENVVETSDVGNIPLNMWVNLIITLIGSSIDIYINGNLKKRTKLVGVPKLNYGDLYVTNWGGYQGYLSNFRYFNYAVEPFTVDQIFKMGPSFNLAADPSLTVTANLAPNYWMTTGFPNSTISNTSSYV
jgi:hypothetical protein